MEKNNFNPNAVGKYNGKIFGFPYTKEESEIIILPIPWEVTTSYGGGTAYAPEFILEASPQLDFYNNDVENAWEIKVYMESIEAEIHKKNAKYRKKATHYIEQLEKGIPLKESFLELLADINATCESLNQYVYEKSINLLHQNKLVGLLGGDHSTPLGYIKALATIHQNFGILQIDAHADLRKAYEGFTYSHASIMFNVLSIPQVTKLVQVGIRDICPEEIHTIQKNEARIKTFFDWDLKKNQFKGVNWDQQCEQILNHLPQKVYISFDIDGLEPNLCPNTGTPVPGGFKTEEVIYLFKKIIDSGREIIGFDLVEVVGKEDNEWDANVGARMLYKLTSFLSEAKKNKI